MVNTSSPIKRRRRSRTEIEEIKSAIHSVVGAERPMTVRQVFYRLVTTGVIDKTEAEYNCTVVRLLKEMRLNGDLPFNWIADNTRWMRKPDTHSSLREMLDITATAYRRALWTNQEDYVEVWLEKDALSGVIYNVTSEWDVPLMVTRGYPSLSFLHQAAASISYEDKPTYLYYFGDLDPSGVDIPRVVEERLVEFASDADISFEMVAVLPEQIQQWDLPTRPTKKTDSRSKTFRGESVELDAIPPATLRQLVRDCIKRHVDEDALGKTRIAEASERELLEQWEEILEGFDVEATT